MSQVFVNNYVPPQEASEPPTLPESELYGPTPYDLNLAYPLYEETLQTPRLKLVPFIPVEHATAYWDVVNDHPELFQYYPFRHHTLPEFLTFLEVFSRQNPHHMLFAIIDRTRPDAAHASWGGSLAGIIGFFNTDATNLVTEIGYVLVFPAFHRTHVAKESVAVLLRYLLSMPSDSPPGIGFRRVQWSAHTKNAASIGLAQRMGLKREGDLRWKWVLPDELSEHGEKGREGDRSGGKHGRHSVMLAVCWDDWENEVKGKTEQFLNK